VLIKAGIATAAIHGNKSQWARQTALQSLKNKKIRVLVATDIAARGIDINELSHVFIYDIPTEPETYVHRIGRTGRAGAKWVAIAFCDSDEKKYLKEIIKIIKKATKKPQWQNNGQQKARPNGQAGKKKAYWGKKKTY
jgi:ATP-dependent RNA helicase RhlE